MRKMNPMHHKVLLQGRLRYQKAHALGCHWGVILQFKLIKVIKTCTVYNPTQGLLCVQPLLCWHVA